MMNKYKIDFYYRFMNFLEYFAKRRIAFPETITLNPLNYEHMRRYVETLETKLGNSGDLIKDHEYLYGKNYAGIKVLKFEKENDRFSPQNITVNDKG